MKIMSGFLLNKIIFNNKIYENINTINFLKFHGFHTYELMQNIFNIIYFAKTNIKIIINSFIVVKILIIKNYLIIKIFAGDICMSNSIKKSILYQNLSMIPT